nr:uncharacterized protein LOC128698820 [Cherax quadricarinatus]
MSLLRTATLGLSELTICSRVFFTGLTTQQVVLSYATADTVDNAIMMYIEDGAHVFQYNNKPQPVIERVSLPTVLRKWRHYCHVFSGDTYSVYVDGVALANGPIQVDDRILQLNGTFVVGQEQDKISGGYSRFQILKGYTTQINIWNYGVSSRDIEDIANCRRNILGNVVSSDRENFELMNVQVNMVSLWKFCGDDEKFVIFPEARTFAESVKFCNLVGSNMYAPSNKKENSDLNQTLWEENMCEQVDLWVGVTDEEEEGVWRAVSDGRIVTDIYFTHGQPDNSRAENCIIMYARQASWNDFPCLTLKACVSCEEKLHVPLILRGACMEWRTQTMFEVIGYNSHRTFFHGFYGLMIYRTSDQQWILFDTLTNKTQAVLSIASSNLYPLGRHEWLLVNPMCDRPVGSKVELSLSVCKDGQYMCVNGECIDLASRCDAKNDCSDESDEDNCSILQIPDGYRSFKPPKNLDDATQPLQPFLTLLFLRFLLIDDVQETINLEFIIDVSWTDLRLKYQNLRSDMLANQLSEQEVKDIWRPQLQFPNIRDGDLKLLKENVYVNKVNDSLPVDFNAVKMDEIYGGAAAEIVQRQHYSGSFVCDFSVFYYPFDVQRCNVLVQLTSVSRELVAFTKQKSAAECRKDMNLPRYLVSDLYTQISNNQTREALIEVGYLLTRRFTLIVLSIYLPSVMLMVIGYTTLYVKVQMLDVRLVVSLTTLLVLYTFFNQTSTSLPQTAYVKMIDVWFFFCTSLLFVIIVIHVFVEKLASHGKDAVEYLAIPPRLSPLNPAATVFFGKVSGKPRHLGWGEEETGSWFWQYSSTSSSRLRLLWKQWYSSMSAEMLLFVLRTYVGPVVILVFFVCYCCVIFS